ncbi:MAG: TonB-dependent receptor, partial [Bacteroidota bacterium]
DNLTHRIEIDMIRLTGPAFEKVDNRLLSLLLVKNGLTDAAMFGPDGNVLQASNAVYKKNILVLRGRFRPVTHVNMDMLIQGLEQFRKEPDVNPDTTAVIFELTLKDLSAEGQIDEKDFLDRVDILCSMGHMVMISNYLKYYKLVSYLSDSVRNRKVGVILGIDNLRQIFDAQYYDTLKGGMLEALGILFGRNVKLFVYPSLNRETGALNTFNDMDFGDDLDYILNYLRSTDRIAGIKSSNRDILHIYSDMVLSMIKSGQAGWDTMVPSKVAEMIRNNCLFDCKEEEQVQSQ